MIKPFKRCTEAAKTRLRPVLMTAIAMIIGMLPAAFAFGEGGEQTAPLGRSVIGGLIVATTVTLIIVPIIYSLLRIKMPQKYLLDEELKGKKYKMSLFNKELKFKIFFLSCLFLILIIFIFLSKKNHEILAANLEKQRESEKDLL